MVNSIYADIHYAVRTLIQKRSFSIIAILTLAVGIGATTAMISVVRSVLLHALPFADSSSLMFLVETVGPGVGSVSYPNYLDWREQNRVFSELAAYSSSDLNLNITGTAERIYGEVVTDSYFPLLRTTPAIGRNFSPQENSDPSAPAVAIISSGLWKREFASSPAVLGHNIRVNDSPFTVIGVAPETFNGVTGRADLWVPLNMRDRLFPQTAQFHYNAQRDIHWHKVIGRLKPEVTLDQARSEMNTIGARLSQAYPQANRQRGVQVTSAFETYLGRVRSPLLLLLAASGCVFLVASLNVANLFLIRATSKTGETAIRAALGANPGRLMQQWIVEAVLIALCGGALGFALAAASIDPIVRILPVRLPVFSVVRIDAPVFALTVGLSILTGILLGFAACRRAGRRDVLDSIKNSRGGALLTAAEIAIAVVVTIGAGLLLRSLQQLQRTDPGFEADHLVMARFEVPTRYAGDARFRVAPQVADRLRTLPQVQSVALTILNPFIYAGINRGLTIEGHTPLSAAEQDEIYVQEISPDYFSTMKIPLRSGRDFTLQDNNAAPHVVVVSRAMAQRYWPGQDAVGKKIKYGPLNSNYAWMEVVGEAADVRVASLRADPNSNMVLYAPLAQSEVITNMSALVRTKTDPSGFAGTLRSEIQGFDPEMPVYSVATMDERIEGETEATRSFAMLLAMCAMLGGGLAAIGAYAAMAARVGVRIREIGIRMAIGAPPVRVLRMILLQGARLAIAGIALGLPAGMGAGRLLAAELYGVGPNDPSTIVVTAVLVFCVAIMACWIPAKRAMKVNPVVALRTN